MSILEKFFLDKEQAVLVVIDVQERLCAAMDQSVLDKLTANTIILQEAAQELGIPMLATEQYVKGLGPTISCLAEKLPTTASEKMTFSCCGDDIFMERLKGLGRRQVIITGMETHVCVLQTILQLLEAGFTVHVVKDAVMSRKKENWQMALEYARQAGAVITSTEAAVFQLLRIAGTDAFKKLSKLLR